MAAVAHDPCYTEARQGLNAGLKLSCLWEKTKQKTYLYVVSIGAGLSEYRWDGWITANFQLIFGTLIPLEEIGQVECCIFV